MFDLEEQVGDVIDLSEIFDDVTSMIEDSDDDIPEINDSPFVLVDNRSFGKLMLVRI